MKSQPHYPPRWPLKLLRLFLKKEYVEEIEGDMEEMFYENAARLSPGKARRIYTWDVIKLLRPVLMRNMTFIRNMSQLNMFQNYFKVSLRGLMKNPVNSFINIIGLSFAIGFCVFGYAFSRWTFSTDQFHEHKDEVFLVTFTANRDGAKQLFGRSPRPMGEMMRQDLPQVKKMCRVEDRRVVVKHHADVFHQRVRFTDPEFLEMFTFPMKWGTASSLHDVNSVIISATMAEKYFGEDNPLGQSLHIIFTSGVAKDFTISGVAQEFPKALTIRFDFLINFENFHTTEPSYDVHDWSAFVDATFVQLHHPNDTSIAREGLTTYVSLQREAVKEDWAISSFGLEPLAMLHQRSEYIRDDISRSSRGNYVSVMFLVGVSVFLLALASFNYINIAIVTATRRLKEIGLRKCIGASRRTIAVQFLAENVVISFFALLVGLLLAYAFFIPGFERLWSFNMGFRFSDPNLWVYLPLLLVITSIVSGFYPSLYISRFQVVTILKGSVVFGTKNRLTKVLLGLQLIMASIFITTSIMFAQNNDYLNHRSWGYNQENALYARIPDGVAYEKLQALMMQEPDVISISGSSDHIGKSYATTVLHLPDREYEADRLGVDARYLSTLEIPLKEGRDFKDHEGTDRKSAIVNELMARNMGWITPIGQQFRIDSVQYEVIGLVSDFHNLSFSTNIRPIIFTLADKQDFRYLTLQVKDGKEIDVYKKLEANWSKLYPEIPFDGNLQEDVWGFYYEEIKIYTLVWRVLATMAISLATLGLYGMVKLNIEGRTKEFSVRKILGAGLTQITGSIARPYTILFISTLALGAPLGFMFGKWIIEFAHPYHMPITFSGVSLAVLIVVIGLAATVSTQVSKVFRSNPVEGLKAE